MQLNQYQQEEMIASEAGGSGSGQIVKNISEIDKKGIIIFFGDCHVQKV